MSLIQFGSMTECWLRRNVHPEEFEHALEQYARFVAMVSHRRIKRDFSATDLYTQITSGLVTVIMIDTRHDDAVGMIQGRILPQSSQECIYLRVLNFHVANQREWVNLARRQIAFRYLKNNLVVHAAQLWMMLSEEDIPQAPAAVELRFYGRPTELAHRRSTALVPVKPTRP